MTARSPRALPVGRVLICVVFALAGCRKASEPKGESKPAIEKVAERGPIRLTVSVNTDHVAVAEPIHMIIEASAPEGYEVKMPSAGESLGELRVRTVKEVPSVAVAGVHRWRQDYELESLVSGEQTIPELTIHYRGTQERTSGREAAGGTTTTQPASAPAPQIIEGDLSTEPFAIQVTSSLAGDADPSDLKHLRDIKGPVDVPLARQRHWKAWTIAAIILLVLMSGAWLYLRRRRRRLLSPLTLEPGAWATQEFRRLESELLVEQGRYHEFYFRLSDIVREYIERRFTLMAPERTTEEFLREVHSSPVLRDEHQQLLRGFLESADMVKFALYEPGREEAEKAFTAARDFVDETAYVPSVQTTEESNREDAVVAEKADA